MGLTGMHRLPDSMNRPTAKSDLATLHQTSCRNVYVGEGHTCASTTTGYHSAEYEREQSLDQRKADHNWNEKEHEEDRRQH